MAINLEVYLRLRSSTLDFNTFTQGTIILLVTMCCLLGRIELLFQRGLLSLPGLPELYDHIQ